jgi:hypothetical protein
MCDIADWAYVRISPLPAVCLALRISYLHVIGTRTRPLPSVSWKYYRCTSIVVCG